MSSMQQVMALLGQDEEGRPVRVEVLDEAPLDENFQVHISFAVSTNRLFSIYRIYNSDRHFKFFV
jgi:hypothetical protein